jgi:hypothetical protein
MLIQKSDLDQIINDAPDRPPLRSKSVFQRSSETIWSSSLVPT